MRLEFLPQAERDLEHIGDYIARDNPQRAVSFVRELRRQCRKILMTPLAYRLRPELGECIRSCAYNNYVIFFMADRQSQVLRIIRILHGAMDIEGQFSEHSAPDDT